MKTVKTKPVDMVSFIVEAFSTKGLNQPIIDRTRVETLIQEHIALDLKDIFTLNRDDLKEIEGWDEDDVEQVLKAIHQAKSPTVKGFLHAIGVPDTLFSKSHLDSELDDLLRQLANLFRSTEYQAKYGHCVPLARELLSLGVNPKHEDKME